MRNKFLSFPIALALLSFMQVEANAYYIRNESNYLTWIKILTNSKKQYVLGHLQHVLLQREDYPVTVTYDSMPQNVRNCPNQKVIVKNPGCDTISGQVAESVCYPLHHVHWPCL